MAWSFGATTLDISEEPDEGSIEFVRARKWAFANPRGATGRLKQKLYVDALDARLHLTLTAATKDALQAIYEADTAFTFVCPRAPYDGGVSMVMTEFSAVWDSSVRGEDGWFNCNMTMVED